MTLAVFPLMVLLRTVSSPPLPLRIPPPLSAVFPLTVLRWTVSLPLLRIPPPSSVAGVRPSATVTSESTISAPTATVKIRNSPTSRRTVSADAPGPRISNAPMRFGRAVCSAISPVTPVASTTSEGPPTAALASVIACRSEPAPVSSVFWTTNVSARAPVTGATNSTAAVAAVNQVSLVARPAPDEFGGERGNWSISTPLHRRSTSVLE
jgi:hypothetical protein